MRRSRGTGAAVAVLVIGSTAAGVADAATPAKSRWLPNDPAASWVYKWSNDAYAPKPTLERYTVAKRTDTTVELQWTSTDVGNPADTPETQGLIDYTYTESGLVNTNWQSTPPPPAFPVLCASASQCGNSIAGAHYQLIWGTRSPVIQEPLVRGITWSSVGGQGNDVNSNNRYLGVERIVVPAFPKGVFAAKVQSDITQAGALGDPFGSGLRTVWWVYGVGPAKITIRHAGGQVSSSELQATNLVAKDPPSDKALFPLTVNQRLRYRYTNSRWLKVPSIQLFTVGSVVNASARVDVQDVSGPIRVRGSYVFNTGRSGVFGLTTQTSAATTARFPKLGPRGAIATMRNHFFTPLDLATFGFNPVVTAYPKKGDKWMVQRGSKDRAVYGVTGVSKVIGLRPVRTRVGLFLATLVETKLTQPGFPYGSGVRRSWYAPGVGLVKLEFRHRDGSVSHVDLIKRS